jgi:hypothetical protein
MYVCMYVCWLSDYLTIFLPNIHPYMHTASYCNLNREASCVLDPKNSDFTLLGNSQSGLTLNDPKLLV